MDIQIYKAVARIRYSEDGSNLLDYLTQLSKDNYKNIKNCGKDDREVYIGRAQAIDEIKDFILGADIKAKEVTQIDPSDWSL